MLCKKGYYKELIESEVAQQKKKALEKQQQKTNEQAQQQVNEQRSLLLEKLRKQYMTEELIGAVLKEHEGTLLHPMMARKLQEKGTPDKYLQGFVDKRLLEEYGEE